jgi:hypothetical protein
MVFGLEQMFFCCVNAKYSFFSTFWCYSFGRVRDRVLMTRGTTKDIFRERENFNGKR